MGVAPRLPPPPAGDDAERVEFDRLFALLYDDLRLMARRHLRREREDHTLAATALVHEAWLKLEHRDDLPWRDRARFLAFISMAMRRILVDHARRRNASKRGGSYAVVTLQPGAGAVQPRSADLLALDAALEQLGELDPRLEQVVECRFFGGLSAGETAQALDVSLRTVERDWTRARAYLHELLEEVS
jgi:RNA polymerase sigma-70 factor, ECF subfamily